MSYYPSLPTPSDSCWIDPSGKFYDVCAGEHSAFARWMGVKLNLDTQYGSYTIPLENLGWMHWSGGSLTNDHNKFNMTQVDTVYDWIDVLFEVDPREAGIIRKYLLRYLEDNQI